MLGNAWRSSSLFLFFSSLAFAQGGPPLITDDPGTPGDRHLELNSAFQASIARDGSVYQIPTLDLNYGYGDHIQLNLNIGWVYAVQNGMATASGGSMASVGAKWRFIDEETAGIAVSTYPRIDFHELLTSNDPLVTSPGSRYFLPIEVSKEIGKFGLNPEIGYAFYSQGQPEWVYGFAASYEIEKDAKELLAEIHGRSTVSADGSELLWNIGARYALSGHLRLIGAFGHSLAVYADSAPFFITCAGLQFHY
jgi:hypothetical protein